MQENSSIELVSDPGFFLSHRYPFSIPHLVHREPLFSNFSRLAMVSRWGNWAGSGRCGSSTDRRFKIIEEPIELIIMPQKQPVRSAGILAGKTFDITEFIDEHGDWLPQPPWHEERWK